MNGGVEAGERDGIDAAAVCVAGRGFAMVYAADHVSGLGKRPKLREVYLPAITTFAAMIKNKDYGSN